MEKVLLCGELFSAQDESVKKRMAVVVKDGRITQVDSMDKISVAGKEVIDLTSQFVMPGLIDGHLHTVLNAKPLDSQNFGRNTFGYYAFLSQKNAQTHLLAGFTTLRDEASYGFVDVALRDAINSGQTWGPRMLVSGPGISSTGGHGDSHFNPYTSGYNAFCLICDSTDECRKAARYIFKYGADQLKLIGTGGIGSIGDEPGAAELTYEEMKAAIDVAKTKGKISSVHAHGATGIKNAVRAGITSVEHGMLIDEEGVEMMAQYGVYLVPTLVASYTMLQHGEKGGMPQANLEKARRASANHSERLRMCREKGVKIAFGTDAGTPFNEHGKQAQEFVLMHKAGFTPEETLISATRTVSEMMRMNHLVGTVEAGKLADLVAFDSNPLNDLNVMKDCAFVMKGGTVYKKGHRSVVGI